jgi:hypothetical protein
MSVICGTRPRMDADGRRRARHASEAHPLLPPPRWQRPLAQAGLSLSLPPVPLQASPRVW